MARRGQGPRGMDCIGCQLGGKFPNGRNYQGTKGPIGGNFSNTFLRNTTKRVPQRKVSISILPNQFQLGFTFFPIPCLDSWANGPKARVKNAQMGRFLLNWITREARGKIFLGGLWGGFWWKRRGIRPSFVPTMNLSKLPHKAELWGLKNLPQEFFCTQRVCGTHKEAPQGLFQNTFCGDHSPEAPQLAGFQVGKRTLF